ncbi:hypothetical protein BDF22DRAFT_740787 [Syncephalis plumigaleata]|nr:hypothetical protein BDF22DRAFT_740787 [Syncephalis plumigaleata]
MNNFIQDVTQLVAPSAGAYALLHVFAKTCLIPLLGKQRQINGLSVSDRINLDGLTSSTVHALRTGIGAIRLIMVLRAWSHDTLHPYPDEARNLLAEHAGYTLYDLAAMSMQSYKQSAMWTHHGLGIAGSLAMLYYRRASFYPIAFLATEMTVPVVNGLWLLDKVFANDKTRYQGRVGQIRIALVWLRAVVFIVFRLILGPMALWYGMTRPSAASSTASSLVSSASSTGTSVADVFGAGSSMLTSSSTRPLNTTAALGKGTFDINLPATASTSPSWKTFWQQMFQLPMPIWAGTTVNLLIFSVLNVIWTRGAIRALQRELVRYRLARSNVH